jgi:hypothetical protein
MVISKKMYYVFVAAFILILITSNRSDAGILLFSDNFESGSLTGYSTQNVAISTEQAHGGTRSVKAIHNGTVVFSKIFDTAPHTEITMRYWWFTSTSWPTGYGVKWSRLRGPNQIIQWENWWSETIGREPLSLGGNIYGNSLDTPGSGWSGGFYGPSQSFNKGRWMQVELHYQLNTPGQNNGSYSIKFDGNVIHSRTGIRFRNTDVLYNQFYFISNIGTSNSNCINYVDDVEIWAGTPDAGTIYKAPETPIIIQIQ